MCYALAVSLTISIPDEFAEVLGASDEERGRRAREAIALELYREGKISLRHMGELAGVGGNYWAANELRARYGVPINYSMAELEEDRLAAAKIWPQ